MVEIAPEGELLAVAYDLVDVAPRIELLSIASRSIPSLRSKAAVIAATPAR